MSDSDSDTSINSSSNSYEHQRRKLTKKEAGFVPFATRCGSCRFFNNKSKNSCAIVTGVIHADNCCNLWTPARKALSLDFLSGADIEDLVPDYALNK
jgi:hypothetical protein